jgi:hypothetical protein
MLFNNEMKYLLGKEFHNGLKIHISTNKLLFRNNYLVNLAKDKKIIHIGFVDHLPLIDKKIEENNWLHNNLIDVATKAIGIDINKEGIDYLKNKHNIKNIYALDIINDSLPNEVLNDSFDYLFLPDVIEHIGNPVSFLESLKNKFPNVKNFIITTPNAFCYDNFKFSLKNIECINTDHRFWFTPYTLSKILSDSGFKLDKILFAEHSNGLSRRYILKKILINFFFYVKRYHNYGI